MHRAVGVPLITFAGVRTFKLPFTFRVASSGSGVVSAQFTMHGLGIR